MRSSVAVCWFVCLTTCGMRLTSGAEEVVVPNAGFEADADNDGLPDSWVARSYTIKGHRLTSDAPHTGERVAAIELSDTNTGYYYSEPQPVPLCEELEVSVWVRVKGQGKAYVILYWMSDATTYSGRSQSTTMLDTKGEWRAVRTKGSPPADAALWRMSCQLDGPGRVDFDDAAVKVKAVPLTVFAPRLPPPLQATRVGDGLFGVVGEFTNVKSGDKLTIAAELHAATSRGRLVSPAVLWFDGQNHRVGGFAVGPVNVSTASSVLEAHVTVPKDAMRGVPLIFSRSQGDWQRLRCERLCLTTVPEPVRRSPMPKLATPPHPRLFCTSADIERLRKLIAGRSDEALCRAWDELHAQAETFVPEKELMFSKFKIPLPPQQPPRHPDNYPYWTGGSRAVETRVETCGLAYLLTGERKFGELAKSYALALCDWSQWTDPDYQCPFACLDTSHFSYAAACAYDWCFDLCTPQERARLREAMLTKGAEAAYKASTESWAQKPDWPNGFAVVHGGMGIIGLCLLGEDERATKYVEQTRQRALEFLDGLDRDGGFIEGVLYGDYAICYLLPFAQTLALLGDSSVADHPYFEKNLRFGTYCLSPRGNDLVNFCDSSVHDGGAYIRLAEFLAKRWQRAVAERYRRVTEGHHPLRGWFPFLHLLWWPDQPLQPATLADWPPSAHFRDIGWVVHRSDFSPEGFLLAVRSGQPGSHCHYDQNSFVLNFRGEWLCGDPGYGQGDTRVHNTLLIGDKNQTWSPGFVRTFYTSPLFSYSAHDAAECYPELSKFLRHMMVVGGEYVVIVDELAAAESGTGAVWQVHRLGSGLPVVEKTATGFVIPGGRPKDPAITPNNLVVYAPSTPQNDIAIEDAEAVSAVRISVTVQNSTLLPLVLLPAALPVNLKVTADAKGNRLHLGIARGAATDDILLRTGEGEVVAANVRTDAYLCFSRQERGKAVRAAMIDGTHVTIGGKKVLALQRPGDASR